MTRAAPYHTAEEVKARLQALDRWDVELVWWSGKSYLPSTWRCTIHKTEWEARARNIFAGSGCPTCAHRTMRAYATQREAQKRAARTLPVGANP